MLKQPLHSITDITPDHSLLSPSELTDKNKKLHDLIEAAKQQIEKVILGKKEQIEKLFIALLSDGHVLLDDTPGMGKTTLARAMSSVLGVDLRRVQFTSDLMPSDIMGLSLLEKTADGQLGQKLVFQKGPVFTNFLLADEINRASPRTQSALLEAMAEKQVSVDGVTYLLPEPFWVIATQNPVDFSGTFPLPDSQMDRFLLRMEMGYPNEENELKLLLGERQSLEALPKNMVGAQDLMWVRAHIEKNISVSSEVAEYMLRLLKLSRTHEEVITGLSPRSGLSILRAAQAYAWMKSRHYVLPEDIAYLFVDASAHRLVTNSHDFNKKREIAENILKRVKVI